ncbi:ankyrin repeat domain-containing protein [Planctomycetota bacterium]
MAVAGQVKNIEERINTMLRPGKKFYKRPSVIAIVVLLLVALFTIPIGCALTSRSMTETATEQEETYYDSLFEAVEAGDLAEVKRLIDEGANVNAQDEDGMTPLAWFIFAGQRPLNIEIAELLIDEGADVNLADKWDEPPLYFAIVNNLKELINFLVSKGADVNIKGINETPLHWAVNNPFIFNNLRVPNMDTIKLLVDNGAKYDVKDGEGYTALRHAAFFGQKDTLKLFISKGVDTSSLHMAACAGDLTHVKELIEQGIEVDIKDDADWTALFWAAGAGQTDIAEFLIQNNADVNIIVNCGRRTRSLLHQAALTNDVRLADLLIAKGVDVNVTSAGFGSGTPLSYASIRGNKDVIELLVDKNADINDTSDRGQTPLFKAVTNGQEDVVEFLITKGADTNVKNSASTTALHIAARNGNIEIVKLLIAGGADVNVKNAQDFTPLYIAEQNDNTEIAELLRKNGAEESTPSLLGALTNGDIEQIKLLISQGADVNTKTGSQGQMPLHLAIQWGNTEIAELLIDSGADVSATNTRGLTPLHLAGSKEIAELLIAKGADVNAKDNFGYTPFDWRAGRNKDIAELLITEGADVNAKGDEGFSPLHFAARRGQKEVVELLIAKGADVNNKDNNGWTSLHSAASQNHKDVAELLIDKGADVNAKADDGWTSLHSACGNGNKEVAELLIDKGADVNAKDDSGQIPKDLAEGRGYTEIVELLLEHGAEE